MKYITEQYGEPTSKIECTNEQYWLIKAFLQKLGVEARMVSSYQDTVTFQAQNAYRDNCVLYSDRTGEWIYNFSNKEIGSGRYQR